MPTTIQISNEVKDVLDKMKVYERESYNEIIENILEGNMELNERTKKEIEVRAGEKTLSHKEVKKRVGL
jgi:predicted CopG family antitoxin